MMDDTSIGLIKILILLLDNSFVYMIECNDRISCDALHALNDYFLW